MIGVTTGSLRGWGGDIAPLHEQGRRLKALHLSRLKFSYGRANHRDERQKPGEANHELLGITPIGRHSYLAGTGLACHPQNNSPSKKLVRTSKSLVVSWQHSLATLLVSTLDGAHSPQSACFRPCSRVRVLNVAPHVKRTCISARPRPPTLHACREADESTSTCVHRAQCARRPRRFYARCRCSQI